MIDPAFLIFQAQKPADPGISLIALCVFIGWCFDLSYKLRGGKRPSRADLIRLATAFGGLAVVDVVLIGLGVSPGAMGTMTGLFVWLILAAWQISRWQVRKKNPLPLKITTKPIPPPPRVAVWEANPKP